MHIISWNVAGWAKTLKCILQDYGSLDAWLARHNVDILCLQEVKISKSTLRDHPAQSGAVPKGYDTFWATCTREKVKGFNGVATYAREGLTLAADSAPLGDPVFDCEGRAIVTDHGKFVVVNVYVPNSGPGSVRLPFKLKFLASLRQRMQMERAKGKAVILVGDLNMSYRPQDYHRKWRSLQLDDLLSTTAKLAAAANPPPAAESVAGASGQPTSGFEAAVSDNVGGAYSFLPCTHCGGGTNCGCARCRDTGRCRFCRSMLAARELGPPPGDAEVHRRKAQRVQQLALQLQTRWDRMGKVLATRRVVSKMVKSTTSKTGLQEKYRVVVTVPGKGDVSLGTLSESQARASREYSLDARSIVDEEDGTEYPLRPANCMCVGDIAELMDKVLGCAWSEADERLMASLSGYRSANPSSGWIEGLLRQDEMVDAFAEYYPSAQGRFTCWDQYRNQRYENVGSRIDYTIVDRQFFQEHALPGDCGLYTPGEGGWSMLAFRGVVDCALDARGGLCPGWSAPISPSVPFPPPRPEPRLGTRFATRVHRQWTMAAGPV